MQDADLPRLLAQAVMVLVPMILSLTVHEFAHAWMAKRLGDDTAQSLGRLTLNPLAHADPMGTVGLPLMLLVFGGLAGGVPFFGWAKPVPVNAGRFTRKIRVRTGMMLVAAAGPAANLVMATVCIALWALVVHTGLVSEAPVSLAMLVKMLIHVNVGLFVFNMIPIHPLDGQKVLSGLLSAPLALKFERFNYQFGWIALLGVVFFAGQLMRWPVERVLEGLTTVFGLG